MASNFLRYAVVPTRDRPAEYGSLLTDLDVCGVTVVTVNNTIGLDYVEGLCNNDPSLHWVDYRPAVNDFNISTAWNLGLNTVQYIHEHQDPQSLGAVAILNDDVECPDWEVWWNVVEACVLRGFTGCSGERAGMPDRIAGYAFALDLDAVMAGLRADEQFQWWYGDDDIQQQCNRWHGSSVGFAILPELNVHNKYANQSTVGVRRMQARFDRRKYMTKWEGK